MIWKAVILVFLIGLCGSPQVLLGQWNDIDTLVDFYYEFLDQVPPLIPQFFVINDSGSIVTCVEEGYSIIRSDIVLYDPYSHKISLAQGPNRNAAQPNIGLNITTCFSDIIKHIDGRIFASTSGDTVLISADGGNHWEVTYQGFPEGTQILSLASSPHGYVLASTSYGIYKYNEAAGWDLVPLPASYAISLFIASNGNIMSVFPYAQYIHLSTNNGVTWERVLERELYGLSPPYVTQYNKRNLFVEDKSGTVYYTGDTIYVSKDYGRTWKPDTNYTKLRGAPYKLDFIGMMITSSNTKVLRSLVELIEYPDSIAVHRLLLFDSTLGQYREIVSPKNSVYAALDDNDKLFLLNIKYSGWPNDPSTVKLRGILYTFKNYVVSSTVPLPQLLSLSSSYPNPVSSGAPVTLTYTLERAAAVTLKVQDVLGRTVHEEALGSLPPGEHTRTLPTSSLKPGMYFYTLLPGEGKPLVGKVVVAK